MIRRTWIVNMSIMFGFIILVLITDRIITYLTYTSKGFPEEFNLHSNDPHFIYHLALIAVIFIIFGVILTLKTIRIKKSEIELKKTTGQLTLLADNINDVIWKMDTRGNFLYVSPSVHKLRGYTPEEVMKQKADEVLTPVSAGILQGLMQQLNNVIRENPGKVPSVITQLEQPRKDGTTVWTEASVSTVMNEKGQPDFFIGVSRDISERKRREDELRRSENHYRLLAETSLDVILVHDMQGSILYTNTSGLKISGYTQEELNGRNIREMVPKEYHVIIDDLREQRLSGDLSTYRYEINFISKEGKEIPLEVSSAPILINKKPISIIVSARDITERKEAEKKSKEVQERIKQINIELEKKVTERTHLLQEVNNELESFSYSVSHDLRAPLRHIEMFSKLLQKCIDREDVEKCREYLVSIIDSAGKMRELINSLLQLSRTGRTEIRKEDFDMNLLVSQVIKELEMDNLEKPVKWDISDLGKANADIRLIKLVWGNLISNAVKFTRDREKPYIRIGSIDNQENRTWFIKDNGVGYDPKYADKLFGVFQRLHTEEEFEGTGIGLATVKRIMDRHRGKVWSESIPDEGAAFYFYF